MAVGPALTLLSGLVLQSSECQGPQNAFPFLRLVTLYREGHSEEATQELARLSPRYVERFLDHQTSGTSDACLEAASLLETELAMTLAESNRWEEADRHFDAAWQLTGRIEALTEGKRFERDWLLAAGLFHQQLIFTTDVVEDAFVGADRYLRNAVKLYPEDPEILLAAGALLEWSGSLRRGDPAHLKEAEELYSRALRLKPEDPEILLRYGWVLEKLGRGEEAPFLRVLTLEAREDVVYRARMALGRLAERGGRLPDSIFHYEAAAETIPSWQVAYIALGHALHESGSHQRAREVLEGALAMSAKTADEAFGGWWSYELGISLRFDPLFARMRARMRK
ncbi:MAG TPA: tetratricopeptide repeat protein [Vicinamibacteria bacterium]|jgi:tetratricopeptide (TPR) repeat protein